MRARDPMTQMVEKRRPAPGKQPRFTGPKMTLTKEERERIKNQRIKRGLTGEELASRIGTTQGSISNLETGKRHPQVYKSLYVRVVRYLFRPSDREPASDEDAAFVALSNEISDLNGLDIAALRATVAALKSSRNTR